ncbi:hypothetical protein DMC30DRAFT_439181 [Rhodotorula diobovata]|uniref:Cytochrome b561 domain-containing protein n=1 Tax=Rhodotorula diobovata TaxID=5288 RepID=A0A5C5FU96_9BASI|nr:hypothetical protein DMC30DRAFT_439181 [Rhodotorula diobovata]
MLCFVAVCLALASTAKALTAEQAASFFSTSSAGDLSGDTASLPRFDLTVVQNSTHALFVVNATDTAPSSVGWLGTGQGTRMSNADYLLAWPTVSGSSVSWTLSHRLPNGAHGQPQLASSDAATSTSTFYTLVPELTTSDASSPFSAVAYVRARDPGASYPTASGVTSAAIQDAATSIIYASSSRAPSGTGEDANLSEHNQARFPFLASLQFSVAAAADTEGAGSATRGSDGDAVSSSERRMYIAHATLGSLAFLVAAPLAILVARVGRDSFRWFPLHALANTLTVVLVIVCFALATYEVGGEFDDFHQKLGLALLILVLVQALLGLGAHFTRPTRLTSSRPSLRAPVTAPPAKPPRTFGVPRIVHVLLGLVTLALGWTQVANGLYVEWDENLSAVGNVPLAVKVVFWVLIGLWVASYLAAWVFGAVRNRAGTGSDAGDSARAQEKALVRSSSRSA